MINRIINKIKEFSHHIDINHQMQEDQMALTQLLKMFDDKLFIPLTNWSISPKEVLHFCNDIIINDRNNIVEFGSGFSTICIAQLLKVNKKASTFISFENNADWAVELTALLQRMDLDGYVKIDHAPLVEVPVAYAKENQKKWYDTTVIETALNQTQPLDMIIVDGPYGGSSPFARFSAVPFLLSKISGNYAVFLDDSNRSQEKMIAADWHAMLGGKIKNCKRYTSLTNSSGFDVTPYGIDFKA